MVAETFYSKASIRDDWYKYYPGKNRQAKVGVYLENSAFRYSQLIEGKHPTKIKFLLNNRETTTNVVLKHAL